jgi:hypothetical protein
MSKDKYFREHGGEIPLHLLYTALAATVANPLAHICPQATETAAET